MKWLKKLVVKLIGKQVGSDVESWGISKTKAAALVGVVIVGIETLSAAWGYPVVIPTQVKEFLAAAGLLFLRDSIKS